jgi:hypothetical protein
MQIGAVLHVLNALIISGNKANSRKAKITESDVPLRREQKVLMDSNVGSPRQG